MDGITHHPRAPDRAMTALRNREVQLVAHKKIGITAIEHAIELTRQLRRMTGFAACDVLIAGYQQTRAQLNGIRPTALPSAKLLTWLLLRIDVFESLFLFLTQLAVLQGQTLGTALTIRDGKDAQDTLSRIQRRSIVTFSGPVSIMPRAFGQHSQSSTDDAGQPSDP